MPRYLTTMAAAAAVLTLPLLAACGADEPEAGAPTSAASSAANPGPTTQAPPSASSAETPSVAPSSDPKSETKAVEAASEKFMTTVLTLGYPNNSVDEYLDRVEPLMTKDGFVEVEDSARNNGSLSRGIKTLNAQRARSAPKLKSDVKVLSLTADKAKTELDFQLTTEVKSGGKWKIQRTAPKDTATLELVNEGGKWLVDQAK